MAVAALSRKSVTATVEDWYGDAEPRPVVYMKVLGPQGGITGWAALTPEGAEELAARLNILAAAARARAAGVSANRVAALLGYPAEFGGGK